MFAKRIFTLFVYINIEYCRFILKVNNKIHYTSLFKELLSLYTRQNGIYVLVGSTLVYGSRLLFSKIKQFFNRGRLNPQPNQQNRAPGINLLLMICDSIFALSLAFPLSHIGYQMMYK